GLGGETHLLRGRRRQRGRTLHRGRGGGATSGEEQPARRPVASTVRMADRFMVISRVARGGTRQVSSVGSRSLAPARGAGKTRPQLPVEPPRERAYGRRRRKRAAPAARSPEAVTLPDANQVPQL